MLGTLVEDAVEDMRNKSAQTTAVRALLFTDIEGSTLLLQSLGDAWTGVLTRHNEILRAAISEAGGEEVSTKGDSFFAAFGDVASAVQAAVTAQELLQAEGWAEDVALRVRMGIHWGTVREMAGDYVGLDVHRAARIADAARGGQVLLSRAAREELADYDLPDTARLRELGRHKLKDLRYPELLFDLQVDGLMQDFDPIRSLGNRPTNLVESTAQLFGREADIAAVTTLLRERSRRIVTIYGPGGVGKSSLAHHVGEGALDLFPDGVHLTQLGGITDPELVFPSIAQTLGVRDFPGRPVLMDIAADIGSERRLLILDTFEHLIEAGAQLTQLVEACPNLHVLVTSRAALELRAEATYQLNPLPMPDPNARPAKIAATPAVRLFVERVHEFDPGFEVTEDNAATLARICTRLEGMPLAIELGAARMKILNPERLLDRLTESLSFLKGGRRDASLRHRTLRAAIEWSDKLLSPEDREVFQGLSVFAGGFGIEDAEDVLEEALDPDTDVIDAVESLVGKSLLRRFSENGDPRFDMYDMIREYASDVLAESGQSDVLHDRHMLHFAAKAEEIGRHALTRRMRPHLLQLLSDVSNHRAALGWALQRGDIDTAGRIVHALHWVWISQGTFTEGRSWIDKANAALAAAPDSRGAALIHEASCSFNMASGDYVGGLPHGEEARRIFTALGDADGIARIELTRSICATVKGEIEDPSEILMESIAHFRQRDADTAALGLILLGEGARMAGAFDAAEGCYSEALEIYRQTGNVFWPGHLNQNIAHFRLRENRWQEAAALLSEAYDLAEDYNFMFVSTLCVAGLSGVALQSGDPRAAAVIQGGAEAHRVKIGVEYEPTDKADIQSYVDATRAALGEAAYAEAAAEGAAMDWDVLKSMARAVAEPAARAA